MSPADKDLLPLPMQLPSEDGHPIKSPKQRQVQNQLLEMADLLSRSRQERGKEGDAHEIMRFYWSRGKEGDAHEIMRFYWSR